MLTTRRALAWSFGTQFGAQAIQLISSIFLARLLTPDEIGIFVLAFSANILVAVLRDFGISAYLIRDPDLTNDKIRTAFAAMILTTWTAALVLWSTRHMLAGLYGAPGVADVLGLIAISLLIVPLGQPADALMTREMRFDRINTVVLASALTTACVGVSLAYLGFSFMAPAWGLVAGTTLRSILLMTFRPDHLRLMPSFMHWRDVFSFGGWATAANLTGNVAAEGSKMIPGVFLGPAAAALFVRAQQFPFLIRQTLFTSIDRVLLPDFSRRIRSGEVLGPSVISLTRYTTALIWPVFLVMGLVSVSLIVGVFGENWRFAGAIFPWILIAQALSAALPQPEQFLIPLGRVRLLFWVRLAGFIMMVGLGLIFIRWGLEAFAMARILAAAMFCSVLYVTLTRVMDVNIRQIAQAHSEALGVSAIAAVPAATICLIVREELSLLHLALVAGLSVPAWFIGLYIVGHPILAEIERARVALKCQGSTGRS